MTKRERHKIFVAAGKKGGRAGKGEAKRRTPEQARKAANIRWERHYLPKEPPASGAGEKSGSNSG